MSESSEKLLRLTILVRRQPEEMEQVRQARGNLSVVLSEGWEVKLDKLVGGGDV
jgi:hypothetical protein